jgi:general secretion pathway protein C
MWPALTSWWRNLTDEIRPGPDGRRDWTALIGRAPLAVSVLLGLAIAAQVATLASTLLTEAAGMSGAGVTGSERGRQRDSQPLTVLNAIRAAHLFGEAEVTMTAGRAALSRAPLVLTGTIATEDPAVGYAIIGTSATSTHVFHTGSQAAPGILLLEVYPQRVVLLKGEERVVLVLPHGSLGGQAGSVQFAGARTALDPETVADDVDTEEETAATEFKPPPISNAATIMRAFALRPVSIGGERGVRIMGTGLNSKALSDLGLAPGDVILAINGVPVGSPNTPDLSAALKRGGASLMVDRNGEQTSVTIDSGSAAYAAQAYNQQDSDN